MENIGITNETNKDLSAYEDLIYDVVNYTLKDNEAEGANLSIVFINDEQMREMNNTYRNIDNTTDVLSFAFEDETTSISYMRTLGDIFISIDKVTNQSIEYNHSFKRELFFLIVHGVLHLLGYNHDDEQSEKIMFEKQENILKEFRIES